MVTSYHPKKTCFRLVIEESFIGFSIINFFNKVHDFVIQYYRLSTNKCPYFSTTYDGWQSQEHMSHDTLAYQFYQKWNVFHTYNMTIDEWSEMVNDLKELQN